MNQFHNAHVDHLEGTFKLSEPYQDKERLMEMSPKYAVTNQSKDLKRPKSLQ